MCHKGTSQHDLQIYHSIISSNSYIIDTFNMTNTQMTHLQWQNQGVAWRSLGHPILKKNNYTLKFGRIVNDTFINPLFLSNTLNFASFVNFNDSCSLYIVKLRNKVGPGFQQITCRFILKGKLVNVLVPSQLLMISSHSESLKCYLSI